MARNILLAVTGMSPQVVTETLYAIHKQNLEWPDEVVVITTSVGEKKVREGLLEQGYLAQLCQDYARPLPDFDQSRIEVVPDSEGAPVTDARTLPDHEALADFITEAVRRRTNDKSVTCLHASLAGGRKTMTFYLGYSMSLFGRSQDRLSHVLVSEAFENNPSFYYPTPYPRSIEVRNLADGSTETADCQQAEVVLADIPFLRHRKYLPNAFHHLESRRVSFRNLVDLMNLDSDPESIRVRLDDTNQTVQIVGEGDQVRAFIELPLPEYALYRLLVHYDQARDREKAIEEPQSRPLQDDQKRHKDFLLVPAELDPGDKNIALDYLRCLFETLGQMRSFEGPLEDVIDDLMENEAMIPGERLPLNARTLESLRRDGIDKYFLSRRVNNIGEAMEKHLPSNLSALVTPRLLWDKETEAKVSQAELEEKGTDKLGRNGAYTFALGTAQFSVESALGTDAQ